MKPKILELIDFEKVDTLLEGFNKTTGFVTAILDLDGNVLSKSGWRQICTEFHRIHPETARKCLISDTELANKMAEGENYHFYQCLNGLVDVAVPIVVKGEHIANLFSGQFFFEEPDDSFFQKQAAKYGFNQEKYLNAFKNVPVVSKEKVKVAMDFLLNMTQMISEMTFQKLEQMELNEAIRKNERILRLFVEHSPASIAMFDNNMRYLVASRRFLADYNLGDQNLVGRSHYEVFPEISERWKDIHSRCLAGETLSDSNDPFPRADGKTDWVRWEIRPWYQSENQIGGIILFSEVITAQIEAREALRESEKYNRMLFEQSAIGLALTSFDGRLIDINSTFANIIGRTTDEAKELTYWEITPEKYQEQEQQQIESLAKTGRYGPYEKEYIHKDGHLVPVRLQGLIIERDNKKYIWSSVEDITERKQAGEELERFFNLVPTLVCIASMDGYFKKINDVWETTLGFTRSELLGEPFENFIHPDDIGPTQQEVARQISGNSTINFTNRYRTKYGEYRWLEWYATPAINGETLYAAALDITERKLAEENLAKTNKLLLDMMDNSNSLIYLVGTDGRFLMVNSELEKLFGKPKTEIEGKARNQFLPKEIATQHEVNDQEVIKNRKAISFEEENLQPDGKHFYFTTKFPLIDNHNNLYGISGISTDITNQKHAEQLLKASEENYRTIFEFSPIAAAFWDKEAKIIFWNQTAEKTFGWTKDEVIGRKFTDFFIPESSRKQVEENIDQLINNIARETTINENIRKDGTAILCEWTNTIIHDKDGNPATIISLAKDVTEQKRADDQIKDQLEELRRWHEVTLDREDRVIALKEEVNLLLLEKGQSARYGLSDDDFDEPTNLNNE